MTPYVVLLRGINVGGNTKIAMADLRRIAQEAGYAQVATVLNSGNLVLTTDADAATVAARVRAGLLAATGRDVDTIVVDGPRWARVVEANPFPAQALADPAHLVVTCYLEPPDPQRVATFDPSVYGPEQMRWDGDVSYTWFPVDIGHSKLTAAVLRRGLGVMGTARNWTTVLSLRELVRERS